MCSSSDRTSVRMLRMQSARVDAVETVGVDDSNGADSKGLDPTYLAETMLSAVTIERKGGQVLLPSEDPELVERRITPHGAQALAARAVAGAGFLQIDQHLDCDRATLTAAGVTLLAHLSVAPRALLTALADA